MPRSTASASSGSSASSINSLPPPCSLYQLNGKSNFLLWLSAIKPYLFSNAESTGLILGGWKEPDSTDHERKYEREIWHNENTRTCRFIRGTLAMNVIPYVRQHTTAKALWHNLLWLYGEESGIDTQGGPPMPGNINPHSLQGNRTKLLAALAKDKSTTNLNINVALSRSLPMLNSSTSKSPPKSTNAGATITTAVVERHEVGIACTTSKKVEDTVSAPVPVSASTSSENIGTPTNQYKDGLGDEEYVHRVQIHERIRLSPDPSLEMIPEEPGPHYEPHPGRRIDLANSAVLTRHPTISPLTAEDEERYARLCQAPPRPLPEAAEDLQDGGSLDDEAGDGKKRVPLFFKRMLKPSKSDKNLREKFSFSLPLRRLNGSKDKTRVEEKGKRTAMVAEEEE